MPNLELLLSQAEEARRDYDAVSGAWLNHDTDADGDDLFRVELAAYQRMEAAMAELLAAGGALV